LLFSWDAAERSCPAQKEFVFQQRL